MSRAEFTALQKKVAQHAAISIKVRDKLEMHITELQRLNDSAEGEVSLLFQRVKVLEGLVTVQSHVIQSLAVDVSKFTEAQEAEKAKEDE